MSDIDQFGPPGDPTPDIIRNLPSHLRSRCCCPSEPWVDPDHHDHGHTDCYFVNLAADEIENLRNQLTMEREESSEVVGELKAKVLEQAVALVEAGDTISFLRRRL